MEHRRPTSRLFGFDIEVFNRPLVFFVVAAEKPLELFGGTRDRLLGLFEEACFDRGVYERVVYVGIEPGLALPKRSTPARRCDSPAPKNGRPVATV
jgi:hypothetical protein